MAEIYRAKRNNERLVYRDFVYKKDRISCDTTRWVCIHQTTCKVEAASTLKNGQLHVEIVGKHNHNPDPDEVILLRIRTNLCRKAIDELDVIPSELVDREIRTLAPGKTFCNRELCWLVSKTRDAHRQKESINAADLKISDWLFKTISGKQFLFHDNIIRNEVDQTTQRTMIFATEANLQHLFDCSVWYANGTFHILPTNFCQLWTINGKVKETIVPLVYVLMQSKKEDEYLEILMRLRQKAKKLQTAQQAPSEIMVDYNIGAAKAAKIVFPQVELRICLFNYKQSLWRKIQDLALQSKHSQPRSIVKKILWSVVGLAYVPPDDVVEVYERLAAKYFENTGTPCEEKLRLFGDYVSRNYIHGQVNKEKRWTMPRYPISLWNVYDRTLTGDVQTDCLIEEWQGKFEKTIHLCKYAVHSVIGAIREEQNSTECALDAETPQTVKVTTVQMNEKIQEHLKKYQEYKRMGDVLEYISIAGSFHAEGATAIS